MRKKTAIILVAVCAVITAACVAVTIVTLMGREDAPAPIAPDYAPKEEEPNAEPIPDDTGDKLEQSEGGGAVSLLYATEVTVDLSDGRAELMFANPQRSNQDIVLQMVMKDRLVAQSGRITPGNRVTRLDLLPDGPTPGAGFYAAESCRFVVLYYDPVSGEKAMLNTEIPITVTVRE